PGGDERHDPPRGELAGRAHDHLARPVEDEGDLARRLALRLAVEVDLRPLDIRTHEEPPLDAAGREERRPGRETDPDHVPLPRRSTHAPERISARAGARMQPVTLVMEASGRIPCRRRLVVEGRAL